MNWWSPPSQRFWEYVCRCVFLTEIVRSEVVHILPWSFPLIHPLQRLPPKNTHTHAQLWTLPSRWSGYIMMEHIHHAGFSLQIWKFVGDESASFSDSSFYLRAAKAQLPRGSGKWRRKQAWSEKTLRCFHLNLFDVPPSGDLGIISSKRHQTRCGIQTQITEQKKEKRDVCSDYM